MSLKLQLTNDMKAAMKAGEKHRLGVIRLINAAIKQREVDERIELDDAAVLAVLEKMVKQRKDSVSQFEAANREDLAVIEREEILVIDQYLPAKLGEAEIVAAIQAAIAET
ncbi:MAG: GatB/YqeY domain-containing protein, partial [Stenotrophomonas sp.]